MKKHLLVCKKCPDAIKQEIKKVRQIPSQIENNAGDVAGSLSRGLSLIDSTQQLLPNVSAATTSTHIERPSTSNKMDNFVDKMSFHEQVRNIFYFKA